MESLFKIQDRFGTSAWDYEILIQAGLNPGKNIMYAVISIIYHLLIRPWVIVSAWATELATGENGASSWLFNAYQKILEPVTRIVNVGYLAVLAVSILLVYISWERKSAKSFGNDLGRFFTGLSLGIVAVYLATNPFRPMEKIFGFVRDLSGDMAKVAGGGQPANIVDYFLAPITQISTYGRAINGDMQMKRWSEGLGLGRKADTINKSLGEPFQELAKEPSFSYLGLEFFAVLAVIALLVFTAVAVFRFAIHLFHASWRSVAVIFVILWAIVKRRRYEEIGNFLGMTAAHTIMASLIFSLMQMLPPIGFAAMSAATGTRAATNGASAVSIITTFVVYVFSTWLLIKLSSSTGAIARALRLGSTKELQTRLAGDPMMGDNFSDTLNKALVGGPSVLGGTALAGTPLGNLLGVEENRVTDADDPAAPVKEKMGAAGSWALKKVKDKMGISSSSNDMEPAEAAAVSERLFPETGNAGNTPVKQGVTSRVKNIIGSLRGDRSQDGTDGEGGDAADLVDSVAALNAEKSGEMGDGIVDDALDMDGGGIIGGIIGDMADDVQRQMNRVRPIGVAAQGEPLPEYLEGADVGTVIEAARLGVIDVATAWDYLDATDDLDDSDRLAYEQQLRSIAFDRERLDLEEHPEGTGEFGNSDTPGVPDPDDVDETAGDEDEPAGSYDSDLVDVDDSEEFAGGDAFGDGFDFDVDTDGAQEQFVVDENGDVVLDEFGLPIPVEQDAPAVVDDLAEFEEDGAVTPDDIDDTDWSNGDVTQDLGDVGGGDVADGGDVVGGVDGDYAGGSTVVGEVTGDGVDDGDPVSDDQDGDGEQVAADGSTLFPVTGDGSDTEGQDDGDLLTDEQRNSGVIDSETGEVIPGAYDNDGNFVPGEFQQDGEFVPGVRDAESGAFTPGEYDSDTGEFVAGYRDQYTGEFQEGTYDVDRRRFVEPGEQVSPSGTEVGEEQPDVYTGGSDTQEEGEEQGTRPTPEDDPRRLVVGPSPVPPGPEEETTGRHRAPEPDDVGYTTVHEPDGSTTAGDQNPPADPEQSRQDAADDERPEPENQRPRVLGVGPVKVVDEGSVPDFHDSDEMGDTSEDEARRIQESGFAAAGASAVPTGPSAVPASPPTTDMSRFTRDLRVVEEGTGVLDLTPSGRRGGNREVSLRPGAPINPEPLNYQTSASSGSLTSATYQEELAGVQELSRLVSSALGYGDVTQPDMAAADSLVFGSDSGVSIVTTMEEISTDILFGG